MKRRVYKKKLLVWWERKLWLNEMKKKQHINRVYNNISIIMVMLITIWCENDVLLWFWKCASECALCMHSNSTKTTKHLHTRNYYNVALSSPLPFPHSFSSECLALLWLQFDAYHTLCICICISLFVSKVVHASKINATHRPTTFSRPAPYQLFLSATNARALNVSFFPLVCWLAQSIYVTFSFVLLLLNPRFKTIWQQQMKQNLRKNNTNAHICIRFESKPNTSMYEKQRLESVH